MDPPGGQGTGRDRDREEQGDVTKRGTSIVDEDSDNSGGFSSSSESDGGDKTDLKERGRERESTSQRDGRDFFDYLHQADIE